MDASYATKADLHELRAELKGDIASVRDDLKADIRGVAVVVERMESTMRVLAEGLQSRGDEIERKMGEMEGRLAARIATVEEVVRHNSERLASVEQLARHGSEELRSVHQEVAEIRLHFDRRDRQLDEIEQRLEVVEKRLGVERR